MHLQIFYLFWSCGLKTKGSVFQESTFKGDPEITLKAKHYRSQGKSKPLFFLYSKIILIFDRTVMKNIKLEKILKDKSSILKLFNQHLKFAISTMYMYCPHLNSTIYCPNCHCFLGSLLKNSTAGFSLLEL